MAVYKLSGHFKAVNSARSFSFAEDVKRPHGWTIADELELRQAPEPTFPED